MISLMLGALLNGADTLDDAAVTRWPGSDDLLIQTIDVITPIVDDPFAFGRIAAANSLSDVYAMGGRPLWALNLVFFPDDELPLRVLKRIMAGARDACSRAAARRCSGVCTGAAEKAPSKMSGMAAATRAVSSGVHRASIAASTGK